MKNSEIKNLALLLAKAETEKEVILILTKVGLWDDEESWIEMDEGHQSWSTIGNQQNSADSALVEKIINSIDAVMVRECLREGINPESKDAPRSISEAQKRYFNIPNGRLSGIDSNARRKLAKNISLVATGAKNNPSYSIIDSGEGQSPDLFPSTLLSLNRGNKSKIQFVQGKFGMGGAGVLPFGSPKYNLQLIISRRDPEIKDRNDNSSWGVTVIRRKNPEGQMRSSVFTYLAPKREVLSFNAGSLPLLPGEYPKVYERPLSHGTFIKIYEYQLTGLKTNIKLDFYYRFSLLLTNMALPITLYERRRGYEGHDHHIVLSGIRVRLDEDKRENLESDFPSSGQFSIEGEKMDYSVYAFRREKREKYAKNEGIIFTVDGKVHGSLTKEFFKREAVGMSYLSNSILVIVDCSAINGRMKEDFFMNTRDRLRNGEVRKEVEKQLQDILRNHPGLKALREKRRREDIENKLQDSKPLRDVLENIIRKSPSFASYLANGLQITNPFKVKSVSVQEKFKGSQFPSQFKLAKEFPADKPKICPINNKKFRVQYETDAENDYFNRDKEPGEFVLKFNGSSILDDYSLNLWNGLATLEVCVPKSAVGEKLHFSSVVTDNSRVEPFFEEFYIEIDREQKRRKGGRGKRKKPRGEELGEDRKTPTSLNVPNIVEVKKNDWEKYGFKETSALKVVHTGEDRDYDFYINMDNVHLLTEIKQNIKIDHNLLEARFKYGTVLLGMSLLNFNNKKKNGQRELNEEGKNTSIDEDISRFSEAVSAALLPMITSLGDVEVQDL